MKFGIVPPPAGAPWKDDEELPDAEVDEEEEEDEEEVDAPRVLRSISPPDLLGAVRAGRVRIVGRVDVVIDGSVVVVDGRVTVRGRVVVVGAVVVVPGATRRTACPEVVGRPVLRTVMRFDRGLPVLYICTSSAAAS